MSDSRTVGRLVAAAARTHLRPLGFRPQGRRRLWYDDRGWSLVLVEFQSGRTPGVYLDVGLMWLWNEHEHWAFDEGSRVHWRSDGSFSGDSPPGEPGWTQHVTFRAADDFADEMTTVARIAGQRAVQLREQFPDVGTTADRLSTRHVRPAESRLRLAFDGGAAAALHGDASTAARCWQAIASADDRLFVSWEHTLKHRAEQLLDLADDPAALQNEVVRSVHRSRQLLGLPTSAISVTCPVRPADRTAF
ncbi:hypothetical protein [Cryptosporangium japonicum]|uniref:DUF4304 domain-containing protein n=1 Tax=Cryptosporangium japonicum TaxID=80872 RepID=A0ABN0TKK9_9ACTN